MAGDCITGETGTVELEAELAGLAALRPDTAADEEEEGGLREEGFSVAIAGSDWNEGKKDGK